MDKHTDICADTSHGLLTPLADRIRDDGFAVHDSILPASLLDACLSALSPATGSSRGHNQRNLLAIPAVRELAKSPALRQLVHPILGSAAFPVRGILFDKVSVPGGVNWAVGWHQDCAIAVKERIDVAGFGPWSVKAGVVHVEPPVQVLEAMVTLRVHLDDCDETNGPLRVIPGSHAHGKLNDAQVKRWASEREAVTCTVKAGGVVVMRPLLLHASSKAQSGPGTRRRVVHIEYAARELPGGLRWHERE